MAKMQKKNGLAGKLGAAGAKAVSKHAEDETTYSGGGDLPSGIENGIAQIVDCKFDVFKKGKQKGEYFFFAQASVVEPETHEGIRIAGKYTSIMEPVCDTPERKSRKTIDDHIEWILNEMRKMGAETKGAGIEDLEELAASIQEAAPYIQFRTWKGEATKDFPNPRVQHQWNGVAEEYEGEVSDDVDEEEGEEEEVEEADDEDGAEEETIDLAALGSAGDNEEDEEAQQTLQDLAEENGVDPDEYGTWSELAEAIAAVLEGEEGGDEEEEESDEEEEEEEAIPEKEEVYFYKVPRKPGQKNGGKKVEAEVTAVVTSKKTVNLKDLSDGTMYKAVPWDKLLLE